MYTKYVYIWGILLLSWNALVLCISRDMFVKVLMFSCLLHSSSSLAIALPFQVQMVKLVERERGLEFRQYLNTEVYSVHNIG